MKQYWLMKSDAYSMDDLVRDRKTYWGGVRNYQARNLKKFKRLLPLEELKKTKGLEKMLLLKRGQRLSIQPVTLQEWEIITNLT